MAAKAVSSTSERGAIGCRAREGRAVNVTHGAAKRRRARTLHVCGYKNARIGKFRIARCVPIERNS